MTKSETHIPLPRDPHESARYPEPWTVIRKIGILAREGPAVYGNGPVHGIVADGGNPEIPTRIRAIKGERRGSGQPLGLVVPFDRFLPHIDVGRIKHPDLQTLFHNPGAMTKLFGGLVFIRAAATERAKTQLPPCIISSEHGTIQNYSSIGNTRTTLFLMYADRAGVRLPVMTSANRSGEEREIVDTEPARQFAEEHGLPFVPNPADFSENRKPKGSYPVLAITPDSLQIVRQGFLSNGLMDALLAGYPVERPDDMKPSAYPEGILDTADLPVSQQGLTGPELRRALLPYVATGMSVERL